MTAWPPLPQDPLVPEIEDAARQLRLAARYRALDLEPAFPWEEFRGLGKARLLGLRTPRKLGGRGLPLPRVGIGLFHLAYLGGTTFAKLSLQPEFSSVLADHGSEELVDRYFRKMVRGESLVGNHITEPGAGSDLSGLATIAERSRGGYVLTGTKTEAAFAEDAEAAIVYARVKEGSRVQEAVTGFLVPLDAPGISRSVIPDLGERWMRRGTVRYDHVTIPRGFRLGEEGEAFRYLVPELLRERALLACIYLGVARKSWEETVEHTGGRSAFGRPLSAQEAVAFPLVEDWARCDAAWLYAQQALADMGSGRPVPAQAALAKWMATDAALTTLDHAIQFHGGRGYSGDLPHEQRWRDVRSGAIAHGSSEIMHVVAAHTLWPRARK